MKLRTALFFGAALVCGLLGGYFWNAPEPSTAPAQGSSASVPVLPDAAAAPGPSTPVADASPAVRHSPLLARIEALLEKLHAGRANAADLELLRAELLLRPDKRYSIRAILDFLATGEDAPTGQTFAPGEKGSLAGASSLRVLLLDTLGQLAKAAGTDDAATLGRQILETPGSPEEWAVSLRNIAWHEPQSAAYLASKMREMLGTQAWISKPGAGLLEAFDVIVFTRDPTFIPPLTAMVSGENASLQRAAAVALDRLSEAAPLQVMNYLNANPGVGASLPFVRADFFSKADLGDPQQRQAVEYYLGRTDIDLGEKAKLLRALVTPASFISDNLLTAPPAPVDDTARLETLSKVTAQWLKGGRFPTLNAELFKIQSRLVP